MLISLALAALGPLYAQDTEYFEPAVDEDQKSKTEVYGSFESEWHEFNNMDFRKLDESSDQAILDSDDRNRLAFTGARLSVAHAVDSSLRIAAGMSHRGLWGNDQVGTTNRFGGFFYFDSLYADIRPNADSPIKFRVGRQAFSLGGVPRAIEFVYNDIVDQLRVEVSFGAGALILLPVNVAAMAAQDDANFVGFLGQSDLDTFGFRGDRMTTRHGGQLVLDEIGKVEVRAYGFYTHIGAIGSTGTGADASFNGRNGNFSDKDWVANFGARTNGDFGAVRPFLAIDLSTGMDHKEAVAQDVDCTGFAGTLGAELQTGEYDEELTGPETKGFRSMVAIFQATGPAYSNNGLQFSHGYCGMKGRHAGGTIGNRYMGMHPTAYVGLFGIDDSPNNLSRRAGARVAQASAGYDLGKVDFRASWWFMQDTSLTELNFNQLDTITPPFGYSREEFRAQRRAGEILGQEINLDLRGEMSANVTLFANGAIWLPGGYYKIPVARVAGTALGSKNAQAPWGAYAGTQVQF